jgi:hypothetical protein
MYDLKTTMIDLDKLLEAGKEDADQGTRFACAYGRASAFLCFLLGDLPPDRFQYWAGRLYITADERRAEAAAEAAERALKEAAQ